MKNQNTGGHGIFYIMIPITAIILAFVINIFYDKYHQKKLETDTIEIINYILSRDFETIEEYKTMALEEYEKRDYDDNPDLLDMRMGHEYMVFIKYYPINDLTTIFNIFKINWINKSGELADDEHINEVMDRNTGVLIAKYIIYLNEYKEAIIEPYTPELEHELEEKEKEKYPIFEE